MEKFRVQIEAVKKYHFWILFGLVVLISVAVWSIASADSSARYDKGTKRLKDVENKVKTISIDTKHPNAATITELQDLIGKVSKKSPGSLSNQVFVAWKKLYFDMLKDNELPDIFNSKGGDPLNIRLQKEFEDKFHALWRPMEEIATLPNDQGFSDNDRDKYQYHIKSFFPTLLDLIEWRHVDTTESTDRPGTGASRRPGPGSPADESKKMIGIVDWADPSKVMGRFDKWSGSPTTLQIMIAQEDLWVYESMLKVIRNTNNMGNTFDEKKSRYLSPGTHKAARVKQIQEMEICQDALINWQKADQSVIHLSADGAAAGAPAAAKLDVRPTGFPAAGAAASGISPLANRYVDENGKPLEDPLKQPFAEFRMMPIYMRVVIEQSAIPRLLAACANSSMRIDVTAVRVLGDSLQKSPPPSPYEPATSDGGAAAPGVAGGAAPGMRNPGPGGGPMPMQSGMHRGGGLGSIPGGGHGGGGILAGDNGTSDEDEAANSTFPTVIVEIHGIVYIYNKPKFSQLGKGSAAGGGAADATAPTGGNDDSDADSGTDIPAAAGAAGGASTGAAAPADTSKAPAAGTATSPAGSPPAKPAPTSTAPNKVVPTNGAPAR